MNREIIILFWRDTKWLKTRGCAENVWLNIYPEEKKYYLTVTMWQDITPYNIVEVKRKSDIDRMIKYLKGHGYTEVEKVKVKGE